MRTLFDPDGKPGPAWKPWQIHSQESQDAAFSMIGRAETIRDRVLALIRGSCDGLTDEELTEMMGLNPSTVRPRRIELMNRGLITDFGRRRNHSGRLALIWVATRTAR